MGNNITRSIKGKEIEQKWLLVDATDIRLGKLATKCAALLMGKGNVNSVDYLNSGAQIVVVNASKISFFPTKLITKVYPRHSGYPGGFREAKFADLIVSKPDYIIRQAVWGMLPKNKMGRKMLKNLHISNGIEHKYNAQSPTKV